MSLDGIPVWLELYGIPWFTLAVELPFAIIITTIVYRLQSKTSKSSKAIMMKIEEVTQKIDSYIEEKKKVEENTKRFYVTRLQNNLEEIKKVEEQSKKILNDFRKGGSEDFSDNDSDVMYDGRHRIRFHVSKIEDSLQQLEGSFTDPEIRFEILDLIGDLHRPLDILLEKMYDWKTNKSRYKKKDIFEIEGKTLPNER
jgi:formyltetrahydrofolate hydrolase